MKSKFIKTFLSIMMHLVAFVGIIASWFSLAKFYFKSFPPIGADFYQFVNFTSYFKKYLTWLPASWKYVWFSGHPTFFDYGVLHSYLTLPLTKFFNETDASRIYLLITLALYLIFSYLLFWELSKNRIFSLVLSISIAWSYNLYTGLFFSGTAGYAATQMFLPIVLYLVVRYFKSQNKKFLLLGASALGLAFWGHTGLTIFLIFIPVFLVIFCWSDKLFKFFNLQKIKDLSLFFIASLFIAGFALYPTFYSLFNVSQEQASGVGFGFVSKQYPEAISDFIQSNNPFLLVALFVAGLFTIIAWRIKELKEAKAFLILVYYFLVFGFLFIVGHNPIANAIGPDRTFFGLSLALACLIASFWPAMGKKFTLSFSKFFKAKPKERISLYFRMAVIVILAFSLFQAIFIKDYLKVRKGDSSLMPTEINDTLVKNNQEVVQKTFPAWLNTKETNFRLYEINNSVNIWWNIIFDLPIVKGYFPVMPSQGAVNWLYWADQTFIGEIVKHFNTPVSVARNSALFLIDWYGVKYLDNQGEPLDIADYLIDESGFIKNKVQEEGKLKFLEVNDEFTSPIVRPVNSPNILVVSNDNGYDTILRVLGMENLNSKYLIPVHGPEYLDKIKKEELSSFDAIFLYNYKYKNRKVWDNLEKYVENGGKLIIETGSEVKESALSNTRGAKELPSVFPITKTSRQELGTEWNLQNNGSSILTEASLDKFSPLIFENLPWKLSYAEPGDVKSWGRVVLSQKGKPILVEGSLGQGKVIWSGMSLPYHIQTYQNFDESRFFRNLLNEILNLKKDNLNDFRVERSRPESIKISAQNFSGVLFKENFYPGWKAFVGHERLKIYKAGPDFMYLKVPDKTGEVRLSFVGSVMSWILFILTLATSISVLVFLIFGGQIFKRLIPTFGLDKKIKKWWNKEDEE